MMPGMRGRLHPRKMQKMMKQLGISVDELPDVEEIIIKTATKDYVFGSDASVTVMDARGQKTYQIMGEPKVILKEDKSGIPQEDVELVAAQAGVSEAEARKALEECDGNPAEAILKLTS